MKGARANDPVYLSDDERRCRRKCHHAGKPSIETMCSELYLCERIKTREEQMMVWTHIAITRRSVGHPDGRPRRHWRHPHTGRLARRDSGIPLATSYIGRSLMQLMSSTPPVLFSGKSGATR